MNEQQALVQAILEHPDDTARRLIYADWLEENGYNRDAVFIREQCEAYLASERLPYHEQRLAPWSRVGGLWVPDVPQEKDERWHLLSRVWGRQQPERCYALMRIGKEFLFRRGFVEYGSFRAQKVVENAEKLFSMAPFLFLTITSPNKSAMDAVEQPKMSQIVGLDLSNTLVDLQDVERFARFEHLQALHSLKLPGSNLTANAFNILSNFPRLEQIRQLDFSYSFYDEPVSRITHSAIEAFATLPLPNLSSLLLKSAVTPEAIEVLVNSPLVSNLKVLELTYNQVTEATLQTIANSPYLDNEMQLRMGHLDLSLWNTSACQKFRERFPNSSASVADDDNFGEWEDYDDEWE